MTADYDQSVKVKFETYETGNPHNAGGLTKSQEKNLKTHGFYPITTRSVWDKMVLINHK